MENNKENLEKDLLELKKQKEDSDKRLLTLEVVIGVATLVMLVALLVFALLSDMQNTIKNSIIIASFIFALTIVLFLVRIEQIVGYYECKKCHHRYVPRYLSVLCAPHINRTRYMRCPKCNKRSWQKKVISKY